MSPAGDDPFEPRRRWALVWLTAFFLVSNLMLALALADRERSWWTRVWMEMWPVVQAALLAVWLGAGREPWSLRVVGALGGLVLLTGVTSAPFAFAEQRVDGWSWFDWQVYFDGVQAGGAYLLIYPPLIAAVALAAYRGQPARGQSHDWRLAHQLTALALGLAGVVGAIAILQPYWSWVLELPKYWVLGWTLPGAAIGFGVLQASAHIVITITVAWALFGKGRPLWRLNVALFSIPIGAWLLHTSTVWRWQMVIEDRYAAYLSGDSLKFHLAAASIFALGVAGPLFLMRQFHAPAKEPENDRQPRSA